MRLHPWIICLGLLLACGCGEDVDPPPSNNGENNGANNGQHNGANNGDNNGVACIRCAEYTAACRSEAGCPDVDAMCEDSFALLEHINTCLCAPDACATECDAACGSNGENLDTCGACQNNHLASTCAEAFNACARDA